MREEKGVDAAEKYMRAGYIFNMIALFINASESVVILSVASRTVGNYDAGILTIAFTIANLMMMVGKFGIRNYQVTDIKNKYSFISYKKARYLTLVIMVLATFSYITKGILWGQYSFRKSLIIIGVTLLYVAETLEDVYWGEYQRQGRLDVGAKIFSARWLLTIINCCIWLVLTHNTILAVYSSVIVDWGAMVILLIISSRKLLNKKIENTCRDNLGFGALLKECLPLAINSVLYYYIVNASKYAIDGVLPDDIQAFYGYVSMPIFVIGLLNSILYQPILLHIAQEWENCNLKALCNRIKKQSLIACGLTIVCIIGAWLIGIPVLSWLYGTDLQNYKAELIILLLGGGWLALANFFSTVLTTMRKLKLPLITYTIVAILSLIFTKIAVKQYGTVGAATVNMIWTLLLATVFGMEVFIQIKKVRKRRK